ncbi:MAG: autotransporter outer membrane beta-barrel domain-containing protein [Burkholderiales bacterium]
MNAKTLGTLRAILGCGLLWYGGAALAFTLITPPPEQTTPSSDVTSAATFVTQTQPVVSAIRSQTLGLLLRKRARNMSMGAPVLAANGYTDTLSDFQLAAATMGDAPGSGSGGSGTNSLWLSAAFNSQENTFSRTQFDGDTRNMLAGFDVTRSDRYVAGVALGYEGSNYSTQFNNGSEETSGYNLNPYFAYLLSDSWSVDLSLGHGAYNTRQTRQLAIPPLVIPPVNSEFSSTRDYAAANLTNVLAAGNWKLTDALGAQGTRRKQDAYMETDGTSVAASNNTVHQWSFSTEASYGRGNSEYFLGALYEDIRNPVKIEFASGEQPANDPTSVLVTAGWRYYGKGVSANFTFSSRQAQEQFTEYGVLMMFRIDL